MQVQQDAEESNGRIRQLDTTQTFKLLGRFNGFSFIHFLSPSPFFETSMSEGSKYKKKTKTHLADKGQNHQLCTSQPNWFPSAERNVSLRLLLWHCAVLRQSHPPTPRRDAPQGQQGKQRARGAQSWSCSDAVCGAEE